MDTVQALAILQNALSVNISQGQALQLAMDLLNGIANPQLAQLQTLSDQNAQLASDKEELSTSLSSEQAKTAELTGQIISLQSQVTDLTAQVVTLTPVTPADVTPSVIPPVDTTNPAPAQ